MGITGPQGPEGVVGAQGQEGPAGTPPAHVLPFLLDLDLQLSQGLDSQGLGFSGS